MVAGGAVVACGTYGAAPPETPSTKPEPSLTEKTPESGIKDDAVADPVPEEEQAIAPASSAPKFNEDSTPIDIISAASEVKNGEKEKNLDWEDYSRKLVRKFDKK